VPCIVTITHADAGQPAHVHGALAHFRAPLRCAGPLRAAGDAKDGGAVHCLADGSRDGCPAGAIQLPAVLE